ncbi:hypothetical protein D3C71_1262250 [compost metagenome]
MAEQLPDRDRACHRFVRIVRQALADGVIQGQATCFGQLQDGHCGEHLVGRGKAELRLRIDGHVLIAVGQPSLPLQQHPAIVRDQHGARQRITCLQGVEPGGTLGQECRQLHTRRLELRRCRYAFQLEHLHVARRGRVHFRGQQHRPFAVFAQHQHFGLLRRA